MVQWWGEEVSFNYTDKQTKQLGMEFIWLLEDNSGINRIAPPINVRIGSFSRTQIQETPVGIHYKHNCPSLDVFLTVNHELTIY